MAQRNTLARETDLFIRRCSHRHRFIADWGRWISHNGERWKEEPAAAAAFQSVLREVGDLTNDDVKDVLLRASTAPELQVSPDELDPHRHLLCMPMGVVDLRNGERWAHDPNLLMTRCTDLSPAGHQDNIAEWEDLVAWSIGPELLLWFQRVCGYILTGENRERQVYVSLGNGANGKSLIWGLIRKVMGSYARIAPRNLITNRDADAREDAIAACRGFRLLVHSEPEPGHKTCEAFLKEFSGEDTVSARKLYGESFDFSPTAKIVMVANHKPRIRGTDDAIWGRLQVVYHPNTIPPEERDTDLGPRLYRELGPQILQWMIEGAQMYYDMGLGVPEQVQQAGGDYRAEMDQIGAFLGDACVEGGRVANPVLYSRYMEWCEDNGERSWRQRDLTTDLKRRGYHQVVDSGGRYWNNLSLRDRGGL